MITMGRHRTAAPGGGGSTAMETDAAALYWYDGQALGAPASTITSWPDATGNGMDLGQHTTVPLPVVNATGDGALFDGTQALADMTIATAGRMTGTLDGGGEVSMFAVVELDASGSPEDTVDFFSAFMEGANENGDYVYLEMHENTFADPNIGGMKVEVKSVTVAAGGEHFPGSLSGQKMLVEFWSDQSNWEILLDGVVAESGTSTPADFPANPFDTIIVLGARGNSTAINLFWIGEIFSVFATANADSAHRAAIRADMQSRYGV